MVEKSEEGSVQPSSRPPERASWVFFLVVSACLLGWVSTQARGQTSDTYIERLGLEVGKPRTVTIYPGVDVEDNGDLSRSGRVYWYLPYKLTNEGKSAAKFFVTVAARSDKGRKYRDLPLGFVEKKIEKIERRALHSKVDRYADPGTPDEEGKRGQHYEDFEPGQTKECVAIFNPIDPEADTIVIEVYGLVNDVKLEKLGDGRLKITERVLQLVFHRPGDEFYTSLDKFDFVEKKWLTVDREVQAPGE